MISEKNVNFADMNASEKIREEARKIGLCDQHYNAWNPDWSVADLIDYFLSNPNWCMKNRFPSVDIFKKYGDTDEVREKGVFVDMAVTSRAVLPTYAFMKCSVGMLVNRVCSMYFRDGCKAKVIVDSGGVLMVNVYDSSEVDVETRGTGRAIVNQFGNVKPIIKGTNIKFRKK